MIHKKLGLAAVLAVATAFPAAGMAAKGLEYSYAELGYLGVDADSGDADGFKANLSFNAHEYVNVRASFANIELDDTSVKIDEFTIGAGGHYSVVKNVDVVAGVVYVVQEANGVGAKVDTEGHLADFGVRAKLGKKFELNGGYLTQQLSGETDDGFFVGGVAYFQKKLAVSVRVEDSDDGAGDETNFFVGLRLKF